MAKSPGSDDQLAPAWSVAEAKAKFSHLIDEAQANGPQRIARHGKETAVVVSIADWTMYEADGSPVDMVAFFEPLRGLDLDLERERQSRNHREVDFSDEDEGMFSD